VFASSTLSIRLSNVIFTCLTTPHWTQSLQNQTEPLRVAFKADVVDFIEGNKYSDSELESMFLSFVDSQLDLHLSVFRTRSYELLEDVNATKSRFLETKAEVLYVFNSTMTELLPSSKVGMWKFEGHYQELASEIDVMIESIDFADEVIADSWKSRKLLRKAWKISKWLGIRLGLLGINILQVEVEDANKGSK